MVKFNNLSKDIANDCDLILIASLFAPDIYQQLLQFDIPKEKINYVPHA